MAVNCWFAGSTTNPGYGIWIEGGAASIIDAMSFIGCRILNNYTHGIFINYATAANISFTDCTIAGNSLGSSGAADGVNLIAALSAFSFVNCKIGQAGTAGNTQRYAINIAAGAGADFQIVGNDLQPNVTPPYLNNLATGVGQSVHSNYPGPMAKGALKTYSGTGLAQNGSEVQTLGVTLPVNSLIAGDSFRIRAYGTITSTVANAINIRVRLNASSLGGTAPVTFTATGTTTASSAPFNIDAIVTLRTTGGPGTCTGSGVALTNLTAGATQAWATNYILFATVGACTPTTTGTLVLELTTQTAASTTAITWQMVIIEKL
jgi:hypothetical protein